MTCKTRRVTLVKRFSGHESDAAFKRREKRWQKLMSALEKRDLEGICLVTGARKLRVMQSSEGVASLFSANGCSGELVISVSLQTNNDPF